MNIYLEHMTDYDLFVYPSIFEETFCASALEALLQVFMLLQQTLGLYLKPVLNGLCI